MAKIYRCTVAKWVNFVVKFIVANLHTLE